MWFKNKWAGIIFYMIILFIFSYFFITDKLIFKSILLTIFFTAFPLIFDKIWNIFGKN